MQLNYSKQYVTTKVLLVPCHICGSAILKLLYKLITYKLVVIVDTYYYSSLAVVLLALLIVSFIYSESLLI